MNISEEHKKKLLVAKSLLASPGLAAKITSLIGMPTALLVTKGLCHRNILKSNEVLEKISDFVNT
jgi:hypothetical protein